MSNRGRHVLAIDLGSGGPKVAFVALDGTVRWSVVHAVGTDRPGPGRAGQDAQQWWQLIQDSTRTAMRERVVDPVQRYRRRHHRPWGSVVKPGRPRRHPGRALPHLDGHERRQTLRG